MSLFRSTAVVGLAIGACLVASCAEHGAPPRVAGADAAPRWEYDVAAGARGDELAVTAAFPEGTATELVVAPSAEPFVSDVEVAPGGRARTRGWTRAPRRASAWSVPACEEGCRVRYHFALRHAADALSDVDVATAFGDTLVAPPSTWLLHPESAATPTRFRLRVTTPEDVRFETGLYRAPDGDAYEADASYLSVAPYSAFGPVRVSHPDVAAGADFELAISPDIPAARDAAIVRWVAHAARDAAGYFGCFPVPRVMVLVVPVDGREVRRGHALGDGGAAIVVEIGRDADDDALASDWVLPHEMVHMGFPSVSRRHHWMEEGVAVYVQPIARARAGEESAEDAWRELAFGFPRGEPRASDRGLDNTPTWSRTYWGGALFCLVADLEIRARTHGRYSLEDALRAIVQRGGNIAEEWDFERVLDEGDRAVGAPILRELYEEMRDKPVRVDLDAVYRELGIVVEGDRVRFDDGAPRAAVRRAIMETGDEARTAQCGAKSVERVARVGAHAAAGSGPRERDLR